MRLATIGDRDTLLYLVYCIQEEFAMTFEEACQIYYINKEIKHLRIEIARLEESRTFYKPIILTDMPKGGGDHRNETDDYLVKRQELEDMLNYALRKLQYERAKIEKFLQEIEDPELRLIVRLRCANNMSWSEIGEECNMDRRTASRKFYHFFDLQKDAHNARVKCDKL